MTVQNSPTRNRIVNLLGITIAMSLLGDATMYVVLPTHTAEAGIALTQVGLMLSANRLIRLFLNGPIGILIERIPRRNLVIPAMFIGAVATFLYTFGGFWTLLVGRLLWGVAWAGLWIGSTTMIMDVVDDSNRGRSIGRFQMWFFIGVGICSVLGGVLTDALGYHAALRIAAVTVFAAAVILWFFLPETYTPGTETTQQTDDAQAVPPAQFRWSLPLVVAMLVIGLNWLVFIGILSAILPALLQERLGSTVILLGLLIPISTLTGTLTAANMVVSLFSSPLAGWLSDVTRNRWFLIVGALLVGIVSIAFIAQGGGTVVIVATMFVAFTSSVLQTQVYTVVGDSTRTKRRGRALGILATVSDAGAAAGPLLAYALLPVVGLSGIFALAALVLIGILPLIVWVARREIGQARLVPRV